jgi:hypothetical protein
LFLARLSPSGYMESGGKEEPQEQPAAENPREVEGIL